MVPYAAGGEEYGCTAAGPSFAHGCGRMRWWGARRERLRIFSEQVAGRCAAGADSVKTAAVGSLIANTLT